VTQKDGQAFDPTIFLDYVRKSLYRPVASTTPSASKN